MSIPERQIPLGDILQFTRADDGSYRARIPGSVSFGATVLGGVVIAIAAKAAADFVSHSAKSETRQHSDVVHYAINFIRPVLPEPRETVLHFQTSNAGKSSTILHFEVKQNDKVCLNGYMTLSNLSRDGVWKQGPGWKLSPPSPSPPTFDEMEQDNEQSWSLWRMPYSDDALNRGQSYQTIWIPNERSNPAILDEWVKPGWEDTKSPNGAVWTNENIHVLMDNTPPLAYDLIDLGDMKGFFSRMLEAARLQREARRQGRSDAFAGPGIGENGEIPPFMVTTTNITTDIKQRLPSEGVKWLFIRTPTKVIKNDRCDYVLDLLDQEGNLIAIAQHAMQIITVADKYERKAKL